MIIKTNKNHVHFRFSVEPNGAVAEKAGLVEKNMVREWNRNCERFTIENAATTVRNEGELRTSKIDCLFRGLMGIST